MKTYVLFIIALFPSILLAGVFKCTDQHGKTSYQSKPCADEKQAFEMDFKTGAKTDLNQQTQLKNRSKEEQEKIRQAELQKKQRERQRKMDAISESLITQELIKKNPKQYSVFSIPPYNPDKLPALVQAFAERLPEIEKFRRLAAQKALATGQCGRVEADELNIKSKKEQLVFLVDCSSGKSFYYNEQELNPT